MIDRHVTATLLTRLYRSSELKAGVEENDLMMQVNMFSSVTVTTEILREHLEFAKAKGWIDSRLDSLDQRRWYLTPAGEITFSNLMAGA